MELNELKKTATLAQAYFDKHGQYNPQLTNYYDKQVTEYLSDKKFKFNLDYRQDKAFFGLLLNPVTTDDDVMTYIGANPVYEPGSYEELNQVVVRYRQQHRTNPKGDHSALGNQRRALAKAFIKANNIILPQGFPYNAEYVALAKHPKKNLKEMVAQLEAMTVQERVYLAASLVDGMNADDVWALPNEILDRLHVEMTLVARLS